MNNRQGIALVLVLWIIMVLSLLISGFAFTMHVETQVAAFSRKELKAEMLARSGIEVARMQLLHRCRFRCAESGVGYQSGIVRESRTWRWKI